MPRAMEFKLEKKATMRSDHKELRWGFVRTQWKFDDLKTCHFGKGYHTLLESFVILSGLFLLIRPFKGCQNC